MPPDYIPTKQCTKCYKELPATLEYFYRSKSCRYGVNSYCKKCSVKLSVENSRSNPVAANKRRKKWLDNNPDKRRQSIRKYYEGHKEEVIRKASKRQSDDPEWARRRNKKWKDNNPEAVRAKSHRRRALQRNADGHFTKEDIFTLLKSQGNKCWYCLTELNGEYHIDHRIPLSRGGSNNPSNLAIACPHCNLSKWAKLPDEWIGRLL